MRARVGFCVLVFALLASPGLRAADAGLTIGGEVKTPQRLSLSELKTLPLVKTQAKDHNGAIATYEGVSVAELLRRAGVPQGAELRGLALQLCVVVRAADGYQAVFALAELDPAMTDKVVLLALSRDGVPLDAAAGPLRIVVPDEKRQARWVRQVTGIEVVRVGSAKAGDLGR